MVNLDEVGTLPDEAYGDIHCGFTKCIDGDFKAVFQHQLRRKLMISPHIPYCHHIQWFFFTIVKIKHTLWDLDDLNNKFTISNKWVTIIKSLYASTVVENMYSKTAMSIVNKTAVWRTRLNSNKSRIIVKMIVFLVEVVFILTPIIKVVGTMNRTSLECQILLK